MTKVISSNERATANIPIIIIIGSGVSSVLFTLKLKKSSPSTILNLISIDTLFIYLVIMYDN